MRTLAAVGTLLTLSALAAPIEIIGNLPGNDGTSTFMNAASGGSNGGGVFDSKAAGFTMGNGLAHTLDFVTLRLEFFNTDSVPSIEIWSHNGTGLGSQIAVLSNPTLTVGIDNFVFTPTSTVTLNANTTYWLLVWNNAPVANSFRWMASSPTLTPTGPGATHFGYRFSNGGPPPTGSSSTFNTYSINATPVPEPATLAALGAGLLFLRRRRKA